MSYVMRSILEFIVLSVIIVRSPSKQTKRRRKWDVAANYSG